VTNTPGKRFFESKGVAVAANGLIEMNGPTWDALDALRSTWTLADTKRTIDYSEVVVLLLDATRGLEVQDLKIDTKD